MTWSIAAGQAMSASVVGPVPVVTAVVGTIWVTQAGYGRDHILRSGERLVLGGRGRIAIQAIDRVQTMVCTEGLA